MKRDIHTKLSKKDIRDNKRNDLNKKKKKVVDSDSDSTSDSSSESENEEMDVHEYRKFLSKIFPSKHLSKKIKSTEKNKKKYKDESESESESEEDKKVSKKKKQTKFSKKSKKIEVSDDDKSDDEDDSDYETASDDEETEYETEDEEENEVSVKNGNKVNIIFTIGGKNKDDDDYDYDDDYDEDYDDDDSNEDTENEDEEVSSDEDSESESESASESESEYQPKNKSKDKKKEKSKNEKKEKKEQDSDKKDETTDVTEYKPNQKSTEEILVELKELYLKNPNDKSIKKCIQVYEDEIEKDKKSKEKKAKKQKDKNLRIFKKIIKDKNTMNDFAFYEKLELTNQKKLIKELREINKIVRIEKPYRMTLLESSIPVEFKAAAMKKVNSLKFMDPGSGDYYKIKTWVDTFMHIPFNNYNELPISIEDGVDKCHDFMENAQKILDQAVYGLNDAKMQIMQMLGQLLTNPKAIGTAIAIHGPPGTGKTSLVKEGISKILNRPFAFIALGGATDSSFLEGHSYTYEGSTWGKIVQILIDSKCMNPVIYFDELDKISETPRGEEIAGILTHLTDTSQNSQFHDKYFAEINFDLSKCLFIFSYNDESKINPILKDRMYRIKTKGYNGKEKMNISNNYLLPKIQEQVKFNNDEIIIAEDVINHIVESHCNKEDGVRNLKRCLEIIYTKLNLYRLMKPGSNLFEGEMALKVEFPFKVTKEIVDKLIKKESENVSALWSMYM